MPPPRIDDPTHGALTFALDSPARDGFVCCRANQPRRPAMGKRERTPSRAEEARHA